MKKKRKIRVALKLYNRFRLSLMEKLSLLESGKMFDWGQERDMLLVEIDESDFYSFINRF